MEKERDKDDLKPPAGVTHSLRQVAAAIVANAVIALMVVSFLCYIDEGAYNFDWAWDKGNLFFFAGMSLSTFIALCIARFAIFGTYRGKGRMFLVTLTGLPLGLAGFYLVMFLFAALSIAIDKL